jgi:hypothetical protein
LRDESEDEDKAAEESDDDTTDNKQLAAMTDVLHVASCGAAPELAGTEDKQQCDCDEDDAEKQSVDDAGAFCIGGGAPGD